MSTNYYISTATENKMHIGKSSMGWVFSLRIYPDLGINTLYDWLPIILDVKNTIRNEYENEVNAAEMLRVIVNQKRSDPPIMTQKDLEQNNAYIDYEYNLLRSIFSEDQSCDCRPGAGPWDYKSYEFF